MDLSSVLGFDLTVVGRMLLAAALAVAIGLDRELKGNPAGVRTHVVLAVCAAALGWLSVTAAEGDSAADPTRIASYTVAGISFLGGGLIVGVHTRIHGLTTAVAAFTMTSIGLLAGMGYTVAAVGLTVITLFTLAPLDWVKDRTYGRFVRTEATLHLVLDDIGHLDRVRQAVGTELELRALAVPASTTTGTLLQVTIRGLDRDILEAERRLRELQEVRGLSAVRT